MSYYRLAARLKKNSSKFAIINFFPDYLVYEAPKFEYSNFQDVLEGLRK